MREAIFWPVIAQVGLTAIVWSFMYFRRIAEVRTDRINPQSLATSETAAGALRNVSAADNFRNLLETPVLFYAVCVCLAVTDAVTMLQLVLAWTYVGLRAVHSFIHITYNRVLHRFVVYTLSTICLFVMWGAFAYSLFL